MKKTAAPNAYVPADSGEPGSRSIVDRALIALAGFALLASLAGLVFGERFFRETDGDQAAVGKVSAEKGDVRRRSQTGVAWSDLKNGDAVFEGDSLFTGDGSTASIQLDKGNALELDPQSMVVLRTTNDEFELDLRYGTLSGQLPESKKVVLKVDGQRQILQGNGGAKLRIARAERSRDARVEVIEGEVKVRKAKAQEASIVRKAEALRVGADGTDAPAKAAKSLRIELLDPPAGATLWTAGAGGTVAFKWKTSDPKAKTIVEVAKDPSFARVIAKSDPSDSATAELGGLPTGGELRWRVRPADKSVDALPATRKFALFPDEKPRLDAPEAGVAIETPRREGARAAVSFAWHDSSGSKTFTFQAWRPGDKSNKVYLQRETSSTSFENLPFPPGAYAWRVRGAHPARKNAPWSEIRTFAVEGLPPLAPPALTNPRLAMTLPSGPTDGAADGKTPAIAIKGAAPLQWKPTPGADRYVVERSKSGRFDGDVVRDETRGTSLPLAKASPGAMNWRVRAASSDGRTSEPSETGVWNFEAPPPTLKPAPNVEQKFASPKEADAAKASVKLAWSPSPWADSYELQVGADDRFANVEPSEVPSTSRTVTVKKPGEYFWRVRGLNKSNGVKTAWSPASKGSYTKTVEVPKVAELPKPPPPPVPARQTAQIEPRADLKTTALEPRADTKIYSLPGAAPFVNFRWKPVAGANAYRVEIANDLNFTAVARSVRVKSPSYFHDGPLPTGQVYWRVRALVPGEVAAWSDPSPFSVGAK